MKHVQCRIKTPTVLSQTIYTFCLIIDVSVLDTFGLYFSCDENYSMIPSNVQHSTCENNLRWEPPPPKCFSQLI
jgi:hypothetical protein